jgi:hypothetical protein
MRKIIISLFILFWFTASHAVIVPALYSSQILVADYSATTRHQAFATALQQVLIKVSGNSKVITLPGIQDNMAQADSMVQSYSYSEQEGSDNQKTLLLQVEFNAKAVQQILHDANQAVWNRDRPLVLVWLDITDPEGNSNLIDNNNPIIKILEDNAKLRGIPIILPLLDLDDLNNVTTNDIATNNLAAIKTASTRYNTNTILIGNIANLADGKWQSEWTLLNNDATSNWTITNDDINQVLTNITDDVADTLAAHSAVVSNAVVSKQITVFINNVNDLNTYVAVIKYLLRLNTVTKIQLLSVNPIGIKLRVTSQGGLTQLTQAINQDRKQLTSTTTQDDDTDVDVTYKWVATQS